MIEDLIESGQYAKALELLTDTNDETVRYQRLVCLNGLENYQTLKREGEIAKSQASSTYYEVLALYLNALKMTEEFEDAINILIEELSMPYIPTQYESLFNMVYDDILYAKQEANQLVEHGHQTIYSVEEIGALLNREDVNEDLLYMVLDQLQDLNVRRLIPDIRRYLKDETKPPFAKTLLMEIMIEQQISEEFEVVKYGSTYYFDPGYAPLVLEQLCYEGITRHLQRVLEDSNPTLMMQCIEYLEYILYAAYPREFYEEDYALIAATIHYYVATLQLIDMDEQDLMIDYNVTLEEVEEMTQMLKKFEN
ncbi:MAG: hypothetical protein J6P61_00710 [Erysipelotrichaceae bacterium]|nr:hypothetical protein [Erysipelotrichaceae bacterium]